MEPKQQPPTLTRVLVEVHLTIVALLRCRRRRQPAEQSANVAATASAKQLT